MRLDKYLSDMGAGTRSELKKEIRKSGASIDGKIIKDPFTRFAEDLLLRYAMITAASCMLLTWVPLPVSGLDFQPRTWLRTYHKGYRGAVDPL